MMAHGMAGGGTRTDFSDPKFVQERPCFVFYVLNMAPQLVYKQAQGVFKEVSQQQRGFSL
jgi:hypothetical protein